MPRDSGTLRIIGGQWRRRHITFDPSLGARPTSDRVRETVFNWLSSEIVGMYCLDAFAGSGALGFEALSRGADHVVFIDSNPKVLATINENAQQLDCQHYTTQAVYLPDVSPSISKDPFSLVFLDPPFQRNLLLPTVHQLRESHLLAEQAIIYFECELSFSIESLLDVGELEKHTMTKTMQYGLLRCY